MPPPPPAPGSSQVQRPGAVSPPAPSPPRPILLLFSLPSPPLPSFLQTGVNVGLYVLSITIEDVITRPFLSLKAFNKCLLKRYKCKMNLEARLPP